MCARRLLSSFALFSLLIANDALAQTFSAGTEKADDVRIGARSSIKPFTGVRDGSLYLNGLPIASMDPEAINCLGHATGADAAVYVGNGVLAHALEGLGYQCRVGTAADVQAAIAAGQRAMMVYLHIYPPAWRGPMERELSVDALKAKYGWTENSWREPFVFYDREGRSLPIDYHALTYNHANAKWEWVAAARDKDTGGTYAVDDTSWHPAAELNPDMYYDPRFVLTSIACTAPGPALIAPNP